MNRQILILSSWALSLMIAGVVVLKQMHARQQLGLPGVRTHELPGSSRLTADLPADVLDYKSEEHPIEEIAEKTLPSDTSFGVRRYTGPDNFIMDLRVVLMGRDCTSLHKPQFCLTGQGWHIDDVASSNTTLRIERPYAYDLPVVKLLAKYVEEGKRPISGVYVYWFVCDDAVSASALQLGRMWLMAKTLITTGVLQRWAYVSCFAQCAPGEETATYERMSRFIVKAVPEFQLYPRGTPNSVVTTK